MPLTFADAGQRLGDNRSAQRRSAAKRLRALADPTAGPALTLAFDREMSDLRTWETQYQMVMAIAAYTLARVAAERGEELVPEFGHGNAHHLAHG